ncbi:MAG: hypothetical protein ACFFBP_20835 [Promethearchaeota archaeon]
MEELEFDNEFLTESQDDLAQKVIKSYISGFEIENPPEHVIYGLNFSKAIEELEGLKADKSKKELKKINKEINHIRAIYEDKIKIVFNNNGNILKLIYRNIRIPLKISYGIVSTWTGVLNFRIPIPFIYGRACSWERHKGGDYFFAPLLERENSLEILINKIVEKLPDSSLKDIIEMNFIIDMLLKYCLSVETTSQLGSCRETLNAYGILDQPFVNNLNDNKKLRQAMKGILHFGAVDMGIFKFKSKNDVSTIFYPYKDLTVFQVSNYLSDFKKTCTAIKNLVNYLQ